MFFSARKPFSSRCLDNGKKFFGQSLAAKRTLFTKRRLRPLATRNIGIAELQAVPQTALEGELWKAGIIHSICYSSGLFPGPFVCFNSKEEENSYAATSEVQTFFKPLQTVRLDQQKLFIKFLFS